MRLLGKLGAAVHPVQDRPNVTHLSKVLVEMSKSKLFFDVAASLDGFIAPEGMDLAHSADPDYKQWLGQWTKLQNWVLQQRIFGKSLKLGDVGETGHS